MKVSDIVLAEYANVDNNGRFTLVGAGFASISTRNLPCVIPSMYLLVRMQAARPDVGINRIEIRLVGENGAFLKVEGTMAVTEDYADIPCIAVPFHFQNTRFESEGRYDFQVFLNGQLDATHLFHVEHTAPLVT